MIVCFSCSVKYLYRPDRALPEHGSAGRAHHLGARPKLGGTHTQVDREHESNLQVAPATDASRGLKREAPGGAEKDMRKAIMSRQLAWLRRGQAAQGSQAWRPRKLPRRAALRWCLQIDQQIRVHTGLPGLSHFVSPSLDSLSSGSAPDALDWPLLSIAADRGADGVAGLHFLQRHVRANIESMFDSSHDAWRDVQRVIRQNHLMPFWLVFLVTCNVLHGPFLEGSRYNAMREALDELWSKFSPATCPLFQELCNQIMWENGRSAEVGSEGSEALLWESLQTDPALNAKGYKVNLNRFFHSIEVGWQFSRSWTKVRLSMTFMALEKDSLNTTVLSKLVFGSTTKNKSTAGEATSLEERALRGKINTLAAAVLFLSDTERMFKLRAVLTIVRLVEEWFRDQSHRCREIGENADWFRRQVCGAFQDHIAEVWKRLAHAAHMSLHASWGVV